MQFTGATPPNPPNYTKATYADMADNMIFNTAPPPYYDDGAAGPVGTFATNVAALASGTGATAGGTEGSYPGAANGVVPASTSVPHEGAGTEVVVTNPGNITHTYVVGTFDTSKSYSDGPVQTAATIAAGPNATHASSLSPVTNPTLTAALQAPTTSGRGDRGADVHRHRLRAGLPDMGRQPRADHDLRQCHVADRNHRQEGAARNTAGRRQARRRRRAVDQDHHLDVSRSQTLQGCAAIRPRT